MENDVKDRKPQRGEPDQRQAGQRFARRVKIFAGVKFFDSVVRAWEGANGSKKGGGKKEL